MALTGLRQEDQKVRNKFDTTVIFHAGHEFWLVGC